MHVERAEGLTGAVEARVLCAVVRAIAALGKSGGRSATEAVLDLADRLYAWDGVVCGARAVPQFAVQLATVPRHRTQLRTVLLRSGDIALAKAAGLGSQPTRANGVLTPREREVLELVSVGMRNKEIAAALFLSPSTVKVHIHSIRQKLGARTRAEAAARYAEIEADDAERA